MTREPNTAADTQQASGPDVAACICAKLGYCPNSTAQTCAVCDNLPVLGNGAECPARPFTPGPINGMPFPSWHATWCEVERHRMEWESCLEYGMAAPPCQRHIAEEHVPEIRRADTLPPTRPRQDNWSVDVQLAHHGNADPEAFTPTYVDETVVAIGKDSGLSPVWRLTPGEARSLATALIKAADVALFDY